MRTLIKALFIVWTSPNSLIGVMVGLLGLMTGGKCQLRRGVLEFYGGAVQWLLRRSFLGPTTMAMTLGHTILGQTDHALAIARDHEHVHVAQYERWGPFFIPTYLLCSFYLFVMKKDLYLDNPFEVEAYNVSDPVYTEPIDDKPANDDDDDDDDDANAVPVG